MLQIHERARQGRLRAKLMRNIRYVSIYYYCHQLAAYKYYCRIQEEKERLAQLSGPPKINPDVAATKIQKVHNI